MSKISDKVKVVDANTFKEIQINLNGQVMNKRIRNAKYKRTLVRFNLLQYLLLKHKKNRKYQNKKQKVNLLNINRQHHRKGKQRERRRVKLSKLKKTILQFRQLKQQQQNELLPGQDIKQEDGNIDYVQNTAEITLLSENHTKTNNNFKRNDNIKMQQQIPSKETFNDDTSDLNTMISKKTHVQITVESESLQKSCNLVEKDEIKIQEKIQSLKLRCNNETKKCPYFSQDLNVDNSDDIHSKLKLECHDQNSVITNRPNPIQKNRSLLQHKVHSGRFREYCENCSTPHLRELSEHLLRETNRFQKRAYKLNQIKAVAHRRFVIGFREVQSLLKIKKIKLIVIATDCEKCEGKGGLDEIISNIKTACKDQQTPLAFVFRRRQLGYILDIKTSVSCVGLLNYDGLHETFNKLMIALQDAQQMYSNLTKTATSSSN